MAELHPIAMLIACLLIALSLSAQHSLPVADKIRLFTSRFLNKISNKTSRPEGNINNNSEHALKQWVRQATARHNIMR